MSRGALPKAVTGERVRLALVEARPGGLTTKELIAVTELSLYQVRNGIRWIREAAAAQHRTPLTWTRLGGWSFTDDLSAWIDFETHDVRISLSRLRLILTGTALPHQERLPDDQYAALVVQQLNSTIGLLDFLIRNAPQKQTGRGPRTRNLNIAAERGSSPLESSRKE
ncbi:hypothetical protein [Amycolatopsis sp. WGS_07]|uniref:hypothetical protein n=1 Tax=Amycolatopsis sp. WGS_07 TaxID=3076764 RepID=UPI003873C1B5